MAETTQIQVVTLRNGIEVVGRTVKGEVCAFHYCNHTQALRKAQQLGDDYRVYHFGVPFYVGRREQNGNKR